MLHSYMLLCKSFVMSQMRDMHKTFLKLDFMTKPKRPPQAEPESTPEHIYS